MLLKNTIIYTIGNVLPKVIGFLLLPFYSRLLSPSDYGIIGGIASLSAILAVVMTLALDRSVFRIYWDYKTEEERRRYLGTIILALAFVSTVGSWLLIIPCRSILHRAYPDIPFFPYYVYGILTCALHVAGLVPKSYLQIRKKAAGFVLISGGETLVNTLLILLFVAAKKHGVKGYFEGQLLAALFFFPIYGLISARIAKFSFVPRYFINSAKFSIPLIPSLIAAWVMHSANRLILIRYGTQADVGILSLSTQLAGVVLILMSGCATAYLPIFYETAARGYEIAMPILRRYNNAMAQFFGLLVCSAIVMIYIAFNWIFDTRYAAVAIILPAMLTTHWISHVGGWAQISIYQKKRTVVTMWIQVGLAAFQLTLNFWLISIYGIFGVILAAAITEIVGTAIRYFVSRFFFFIPVSMATFLFAPLLIGISILPLLTQDKVIQVSISLLVFFVLLLKALIQNKELINRKFMKDKRHAEV